MKRIYIILLIIFSVIAIYSFIHSKNQKIINKEEAVNKILNYPIPNILKRCQKDFGYSDYEIALLEKELKRYLVISVIEKNNSNSVGMYSKDVDNLWHTFILFTKDYFKFCKSCTGNYIHHVPETEDPNQKSEEELVKVRENFKSFAIMYEEIFKEELHPIWFLDACERQPENN